MLMAPASRAAATVTAFRTDPGSYWRLTAGLVNSAGSVVGYWLASKVGTDARAMIAPVLTSMISPSRPVPGCG